MSMIIYPHNIPGASNGLLTDLESYIKLDEASGTLYDSHGAYDSVTENVNYGATGMFGDAISLVKADSDYAGWPTWTGIGLTDRTLSVWWKSPSSSADYSRIIVFPKNDTSADEPVFILSASSTTQKLSAGLRGSFTSTSYTISTDTWYNLVQVCEYSTRKYWFYVNGSYIGTGTASAGYVPANAKMYIGRYNAHYGQYGASNGTCDVAVWSRILDATDVAALYNSGSGLSYDDFTS